MVIGRSVVTSDLLSTEGITLSSHPMASQSGGSIDDPDVIATTIREAAERTEKALRDRPVPIEVEPPTVYRP